MLRLDRMERGLFEFLDGIAEVTGWAFGAPNFREFPESLISLSLLAGPEPRTRRSSRGTAIEPIASIRITVEDTLPIAVGLGGVWIPIEPEPGDQPGDLRDRLVEALALEPGVSVSAVGGPGPGPKALDLSADAYGSILDLRLSGPLSSSLLTRQAPGLVVRGSWRATVSVQVFSKSRRPSSGALALAVQAQERLQTRPRVDALLAYGVGIVGYTAPIDLTSIAGQTWESRASFDLSIVLWNSWAEQIDTIETVNTQMTASAGSETITQEI